MGARTLCRTGAFPAVERAQGSTPSTPWRPYGAATAFEEIAKRAGIVFETRALEAIAGAGFADVTEACRLSDLVVVSQEDPDRPEPLRKAVVEALLFDAAAPTLLVPYAGVNELK